MKSRPYRPYGSGRCPECGAKLTWTAPGEASSATLPGVDCTQCNYGETYNPPICDEGDTDPRRGLI